MYGNMPVFIQRRTVHNETPMKSAASCGVMFSGYGYGSGLVVLMSRLSGRVVREGRGMKKATEPTRTTSLSSVSPWPCSLSSQRPRGHATRMWGDVLNGQPATRQRVINRFTNDCTSISRLTAGGEQPAPTGASSAPLQGLRKGSGGLSAGVVVGWCRLVRASLQ